VIQSTHSDVGVCEKGAEVQEASVMVATVSISDDGMEAFLSISGEAAASAPTRDEIAQLLLDHGVVHGIREEAVLAVMSAVPGSPRTIVAEGTKPTQGRDGCVEFCFKRKSQPGAEHESKKVDFHSLGWIQNVMKTDVVALIHPAEPGLPGTTVLGQTVDPHPVKMHALKLGKGVGLDPENPLRVLALEDGHAVLDASGTLQVQSTLTVHGDVDYSTGDIDFVGSVLITGDVKSDFTVKARKSIEINGNVEDATIEAGGDVLIKNGFIGTGKGTLTAGGKASIHHILNQKVTGASEVVVIREAICAKIAAGNKISGATAVFVGCTLEAGNEIEVLNLGNGEEGQSRARVGRRGILLERVKLVDKQIATAQKQAGDVKDTLYKLVRLQLDKGALSAEQQQLNAKLRTLQTEVQKNIERLQKDKETIRLELNEDSMARIVVRDTLFPNVSLEMNGLRKLNHNALKEVILVEHGGKIEEKPLELD
jgi:uncharacterized protein